MSIFRAYDIRGIAGKDLTEEVAERIRKAFGTYVEGGGYRRWEEPPAH